MPTYGRPDYVAESLAMFLAQDYERKELIVFNDCPGQTFVGAFPNVRIVNCDSRFASLGDKRNAATHYAAGELIAVWDDDDVYLPWRLSHSVATMRRYATPFYFPAEFWAYWGDAALHDNQAIQSWISHPQFVYRRDLWEVAGGYPSQTLGEDSGLAGRMLDILGRSWPCYEIARDDRVFVMRGMSRYHHTSISGGAGEPDTTPGEIALEPRDIADEALRRVVAQLVGRRGGG
jgi:glycosyltransferase involved in cell wall biosynthesis